jgi:hypothetical protein
MVWWTTLAAILLALFRPEMQWYLLGRRVTFGLRWTVVRENLPEGDPLRVVHRDVQFRYGSDSPLGGE